MYGGKHWEGNRWRVFNKGFLWNWHQETPRCFCNTGSKGLQHSGTAAGLLEIGDGILMAYEVTGMCLHGTELVSLMFSETG